MKNIVIFCDKCNGGGNCAFEVRIEDKAYDICGAQCIQKLLSGEIEKLNGKVLMIAIRKITKE